MKLLVEQGSPFLRGKKARRPNGRLGVDAFLRHFLQTSLSIKKSKMIYMND